MNTKVTELENGRLPIDYVPYSPTVEDLKHEYQYSLAHRMIERLLGEGRISKAEFNKLEADFREKYVPHLAEIMPEIR